MARPNAAMPTLFKRSDHGSYCFRRVVGTKRTTINTGTSDYSEAKKFLRSYLQGESATALAVHQKQHIHKVANAFAQAATGQRKQYASCLNNIDLIFDAIDRKHTDLIAAKQSGMSRAAWMQKEFSEQINKVGDNTTVEILDAVNNSLQGKDVISDNSMGEGKSFAGPEAVEKIRNLDQSLVALTCQAQEEVQSVITDNENTLPDSILMHKTIVDKDPVAFKLVRKIAAVCLMLSDDNSMLLNYANAAVIADRSIFSIQQEYAVGVGECTEADAMENLIDRYAAQLCGMVENLIPKLVDTGMGVLTTLAQAYCPAEVPILNRITPIIKTAY